ncbi:RDD family protein [Mucilaginibacter sp.]|uniref:RDD family protein n=1 Tax=Mucilaginibacter sp. TaxID=1882438 RepID=UPI002ED3EA24
MQTVKIHTSQNIEIDYEVAGLGERVLARIVDIGVFMGITYALYFIIIFFFIATVQNFKGDSIPIALIILGSIYSLIIVFYDLIAEIFFNGQSVGKYALKIKVVSINGTRPSFGQFLLRWVFRLIDFVVTFGVGAIISVAVSEKKQRIGDLVAGTTVIKTTPKAQLSDLVFDYQNDEYEPVFSNVAELKDSDITLIHEVISNFKSTGNSQLIYDMAIRVKEHLNVSIPPQMNEYDFLLTIVKDYSHVAARMGV